MGRLQRSPIARIRARTFATAALAARVIGCSVVHWRHVERGRANPSSELLERFAQACSVTVPMVQRAVQLARKDLLKRTIENL